MYGGFSLGYCKHLLENTLKSCGIKVYCNFFTTSLSHWPTIKEQQAPCRLILTIQLKFFETKAKLWICLHSLNGDLQYKAGNVSFRAFENVTSVRNERRHLQQFQVPVWCSNFEENFTNVKRTPAIISWMNQLRKKNGTMGSFWNYLTG